MSHVSSREKREQAIASGRLGWSLRHIEQATGARLETADDYLRGTGIALRVPAAGDATVLQTSLDLCRWNISL